MLMIAPVPSGHPDRTFKLEGKLVGPWVAELRGICEGARASGDGVRLDLSGLSFADASGIDLLVELIVDGTVIVASSGFVAELLAPRSY
jgi:hypothetical protein